jgi:RTX calcium-binding nonapeptide repeat (4 copies)
MGRPSTGRARCALLASLALVMPAALAQNAAAAKKADGSGQRLRCTIRGTPGNDTLRGTPGDDVICGGRGDDAIYGLGGDDILIGGPGDDVLKGGAGRDQLVGGAGRDTLDGGAGRDVIMRDRADRVLRSAGPDVVRVGMLGGALPVLAYLTVKGFPGGTDLSIEYLGGNCTKDELRFGPLTLPGELREHRFSMFEATGGDLFESCTYERSHARFRATFALPDGRTQQATFRIFQMMLGLPDYGVECETSTAGCERTRRTSSPYATFTPGA